MTPGIKVRLDRLFSDDRNMKKLKSEAALINYAAEGNPPDAYVISFLCNGMTVDLKHVPRTAQEHKLRIVLHAGYPATAPQLEQVTKVFHPNFAPPPSKAVCIDATKWTPAESLPDLVVRLFNMISYRLYNLKSAYNPQAAQWVLDNKARLPLDGRGWAKDPSALAPELRVIRDFPPSKADDFEIRIVT